MMRSVNQPAREKKRVDRLIRPLLLRDAALNALEPQVVALCAKAHEAPTAAVLFLNIQVELRPAYSGKPSFRRMAG